MLGVPGLAGNITTHPADTSTISIDGGAAAEGGGAHHQEHGGCIMEFGGAVEGEQRGAGGGNRWPRQETMALLKIRSEMDAAFRDSSLKGPLWEEISRKMMELGYKRNAKKCREKFENVFKYHKRTKEGRSSKSEGKTYKFFDQLAALENITTTPPSQSSLHQLQPPPPPPPPPHSMASQMQVVHADPISVLPPAPRATTPPNATATQPSSHHHQNFTNASSSTSSDEDMERRRKRKRKEEEYFREAMQGVIDKQEELQKKFLETLEKKERERMMREEAWRNREMERIKREYDLLAQERSMAAKRHSTLVSFLEKMTQQQNPQYSTSGMTIAPSLQEKTIKNQCGTEFSITNTSVTNPSFMTIYDRSATTVGLPQPTFTSTTLPPPSFPPPQLALTLTPPPPTVAPQPALPTPPPLVLSPPPVMVSPPVVAQIVSAPQDLNGGGESSMSTTPSSSRWPKAEIEALIKIRTSLDNKYQENGPKGPLWEEVSTEMNKLGYNRSSKRCKEKWENINKYFKKVKDNNKKRSEASKTCPYFDQLDALYKEKAKGGGNSNTTTSDVNYSSYANAVNLDYPMVHVIDRFEEEDPERRDVEYEDGEDEGHA